MPGSTSNTIKKFYTPAEANAALPLVRVIVRDITELAAQLRDRHQRLTHLTEGPEHPASSSAHAEELALVQEELRRDQERMQEYVEELRQLNIELKDFFMGLVDFPAMLHGREVYLCWRQGEAEVAHWHELDAGFAGRQRLLIDAPTS